MKGTDVLIFFVLMAMVIVLPSLFMRYKGLQLRHKERMLALEKGAQIPLGPLEIDSPSTYRIYLLRGLIWLFSGIASVVFLAGLAATDFGTESLANRMWRAHELRSMGFPEEQWKRLVNDPEPRHQRIPLGLAYIGLIPIGVGCAYLIFYAVERKQYNLK